MSARLIFDPGMEDADGNGWCLFNSEDPMTVWRFETQAEANEYLQQEQMYARDQMVLTIYPTPGADRRAIIGIIDVILKGLADKGLIEPELPGGPIEGAPDRGAFWS